MLSPERKRIQTIPIKRSVYGLIPRDLRSDGDYHGRGGRQSTRIKMSLLQKQLSERSHTGPHFSTWGIQQHSKIKVGPGFLQELPTRKMSSIIPMETRS